MMHRLLIINRVKELWAQVPTLFNIPTIDMPPTPTIDFSLKRTVAGKAYFNKNHLQFHDGYASENLDEYLKEIVPHEVGHLITRLIFSYDVNSHGDEWKWVVKKLGGNPTRCHSLSCSSVKKIKVQRIKFYCGCMINGNSRIFSISKTQYTRDKNKGVFGYLCKKCNQRLIPF